jgi:DUF971 family protein
MTDAPTNIRVLKDNWAVEFQWPDGMTHQLPFRLLRGHCPCASCVDEFTGVRRIDVNAIPENIAPVDVSFTGNYALKFTWSDRHDTGLYTWEHLRQLGDAIKAAQESAGET